MCLKKSWLLDSDFLAQKFDYILQKRKKAEGNFASSIILTRYEGPSYGLVGKKKKPNKNSICSFGKAKHTILQLEF